MLETNDAQLKLCLGCKTEKPVDAFHVDRARLDGRFRYCKVCRSERKRAAQAEGKVKNNTIYNDPVKYGRHLEAVHRYNEANRDMINTKRRERYQREREQILEEKRRKYHADRGNVFLDDDAQEAV